MGRLIDSLYVDAGHRNSFRRVKPAGFTEGRINTEKYVELVREAAESVLCVLRKRDPGSLGKDGRSTRISWSWGAEKTA